MNFWQNTLLSAIAGAGVILGSEGLPAQAEPAQARTIPVELQLAQAKPTKASEFFKQAEKRLKDYPDYYTLYRVVERLSRANRLDGSPWRVGISTKYDINAYATQVNLIVFYNGMLDMLSGDNDAIACVAGHEMAHHTQNHIPVSEAQRQKVLQQLRSEVIQEVAAEQEDLRNDLQRINTGSWVTGQAASLGGLIRGAGGIPGLVGTFIGAALQGQRQRRLEDAVKRIEQISAEKEAKMQKEWSDLSHRHEFEADKLGYQYMVRAGFNPEGCLTVMNLLNRLPGSQIPGETHPAPTDRMAGIKSLSSQYPTATLVAEGRKNLAASPQPLTFDIARDDRSLRIDSKAGSKKGGFPE
ncbi:MAG: M48 family metalloprotease [Leptolyngbyaceae cyanobacterium bins.349]|nr:M48 family metalloprotease [Leptolyngbyaceae cyanobacterium bins.349]